MRNVSERYSQLAAAAARAPIAKIRQWREVNGVDVEAAGFSGDDIISLSASQSQSNNTFSIGATYCAEITLELVKTADIKYGDRIQWVMGFRDGESDNAEWNTVGYYYIDTIEYTKKACKVKAVDAMLMLGSKQYISTLVYPAKLSAVLNEICSLNGLTLSENTTLLRPNLDITAAPVSGTNSDGAPLYYTFRAALGYIACFEGGVAVINGDNEVEIRRAADTETAVSVNSMLDFSDNDARLSVDAVEWNKSGKTISLSDKYVPNTLEFVNELVTNVEKELVQALSVQLVGLAFDGAKIKKQGAAIYEIGDIFTVAYKSKEYKIHVSGVSYSIKSGFFSEVITSTADSPSQQENKGDSSTTQGWSGFGSSGGDMSVKTRAVRNNGDISVGSMQKRVFRIDCSASQNIYIAFWATVKFVVSKAGTLMFTLKDRYSNTVMEYPETVTEGSFFRSINFPYQVSSGSNLLSLWVSTEDGCAAVLPHAQSWAFVQGTYLITNVAWDGTIENRETGMLFKRSVVEHAKSIHISGDRLTVEKPLVIRPTYTESSAIFKRTVSAAARSLLLNRDRLINPYDPIVDGTYTVANTSAYQVVVTLRNPIYVNGAEIDASAVTVEVPIGEDTIVLSAASVGLGTFEGDIPERAIANVLVVNVNEDTMAQATHPVSVVYSGGVGNLVDVRSGEPLESFRITFNYA